MQRHDTSLSLSGHRTDAAKDAVDSPLLRHQWTMFAGRAEWDRALLDALR